MCIYNNILHLEYKALFTVSASSSRADLDPSHTSWLSKGIVGHGRPPTPAGGDHHTAGRVTTQVSVHLLTLRLLFAPPTVW